MSSLLGVCLAILRAVPVPMPVGTTFKTAIPYGKAQYLVFYTTTEAIQFVTKDGSGTANVYLSTQYNWPGPTKYVRFEGLGGTAGMQDARLPYGASIL